MAYISEHKGRWRAQVYKDGIRQSKILETKDEAEAWANDLESRIKSAARRWVKPEPLPVDLEVTSLVTGVPLSTLRSLREVPHSPSEIVRASVPFSGTSGVYFLMRGSEITYIGQSVNVLNRISQHKRDGRIFDAYSYITCVEDKLDELEALYIRAIVPTENNSLGARITN